MHNSLSLPLSLPLPLSVHSDCTEGSLSLSNVTKGRVEVCYNGQWGTVCDDDWDLTDGTVACRQAGFPGVVSVYHSAYFGPGDGVILMDNVECAGTEAQLQDCLFKGWGVNDCSHQQDAGVECSGAWLFVVPLLVEIYSCGNGVMVTCNTVGRDVFMDRILLWSRYTNVIHVIGFKCSRRC